VVGMTLGCIVYRESFGRRELMSMAIIFADVGIVKRYAHKPPAAVLAQSRRT